MLIKFYKQYNWTDYWQIMEDYYYNTEFGTIKVPAHFVLDFGSIPKSFWFISHPLKYPYFNYFCLHDFFYSNKYKWDITRKQADKIFYNQVKQYSWIKAVLFYLAIRLFGWIHYKKGLPFKKK